MTTPTKTIAVVGLGYIGLPTASMFAGAGFRVQGTEPAVKHRVFGTDINPTVIETLKAGRVHIEEPGLKDVVQQALNSGHLTVDTKLSLADVYVIAVPTPYRFVAEKKKLKRSDDVEVPVADLSYVDAALESILPLLKKGDLVILESTSPPGTTADRIIPAIEKSTRLRVGPDVGVAYCPERVIPGKALEELVNNDRVIGAIDTKWGEIAKDLYSSFVRGKIFLTTPTVAEMVKITENTFRDINIAYANQLARICERLGIDVWKVIELANRHPRVNVHRPGPGVGGHCISVDPWFLVKTYGEDARLIKTARAVNDEVPAFVVEEIKKLVRGIKSPKIALLGLAYKANVDDIRESPAITVYEQLKRKLKAANILLCDPHVKAKDISVVSIKEALQGADLAVVLTAHDEFKEMDPTKVGPLMRNKLVYDTPNALKSEVWESAGFTVRTLGRAGLESKKAVRK